MCKKALRDNDVVSAAQVPSTLDTANGHVTSNKEVTCWSTALKESVTAHLLDESSSVISIDGEFVYFEVENDVPFLIEPDDESCSACPATPANAKEPSSSSS
eukprot:3903627-Heterocapsa_arctica.AAC.1